MAETPPLPCVSTAAAAKTSPLPLTPHCCPLAVGGEIDIMESCELPTGSYIFTACTIPSRFCLVAMHPWATADGNSTPGKDSRGNVFGTYHWANESGHDLHCGGPTPEKRCEPYEFSGRYP